MQKRATRFVEKPSSTLASLTGKRERKSPLADPSRRKTPLLFTSSSSFATKMLPRIRANLPTRRTPVKTAFLRAELLDNARHIHLGRQRFREAVLNVASFAHELDLTLEQFLRDSKQASRAADGPADRSRTRSTYDP